MKLAAGGTDTGIFSSACRSSHQSDEQIRPWDLGVQTACSISLKRVSVSLLVPPHSAHLYVLDSERPNLESPSIPSSERDGNVK